MKIKKLVYGIIRGIRDYEIPEIITIAVNNVIQYLYWANESVVNKNMIRLLLIIIFILFFMASSKSIY